jgi:hypothetical protein
MLVASVPKATIYEYCGFALAMGKVRLAEDILWMLF